MSKSRFVDPSKAPTAYYNELPGKPARKNALRADVYLPKGYAAHRHRRYPLLLLLHGHGDAYDSWPDPDQGDLLRTARGFPGVIVMPEGDHGWYTNWWNGGARGHPAWERYHLDQLLPLVRKRLRIRRGRRWHAIAGLSMGGEGAMYYATQRPGYFGSVASFSGVLSMQHPEYQLAFDQANGDPSHDIWGDPQAQEFYWRGHNPRALVNNLWWTRVFVSVGDGVPDPTKPGELQNTFGQLAEADLRNQAGDFVHAARDAGIHVTYTPHQGIHAWRYWRADLRHAIDWGLFKRPFRPAGRWRYSTVSTVGDMWGLHFRFHRPPETFETFRRHRGKLIADGSGTVTIRARSGRTFTATLPSKRRLP